MIYWVELTRQQASAHGLISRLFTARAGPHRVRRDGRSRGRTLCRTLPLDADPRARYIARTGRSDALVRAWIAARVAAEPFEFHRSVPLGRPPRPAAVSVQQHDQVVVVEAEHGRVELPLANPQRVDVEPITIGGNAALAVVRVTGAEGHEAAALLSRNPHGRVEVLWSGALDMRGDPASACRGR